MLLAAFGCRRDRLCRANSSSRSTSRLATLASSGVLIRNCCFGRRVEISSTSFSFEIELTAVKVPVHVRVGQEDLGRAAFDDDVEDFRLPKLVERLGRENHRGVLFPPSLEGLDDVALNARVLQKQPSLIDEKCLEDVTDLRIADRLCSPDAGCRREAAPELPGY